GRTGGGPSEYRVPGMLLPIAGDSTLVPDGGNRRILALGSDAQPVAVLNDTWPQSSGEPGTRLPRAIDGRGRGYFIGRAMSAKPVGELMQSDSAAVLRSARGSAAEEVVGYIHMAPRRISTTMKDGKIGSVNITIPPFPAQDAWQVFPDGAMVIVRVA